MLFKLFFLQNFFPLTKENKSPNTIVEVGCFPTSLDPVIKNEKVKTVSQTISELQKEKNNKKIEKSKYLSSRDLAAKVLKTKRTANITWKFYNFNCLNYYPKPKQLKLLEKNQMLMKIKWILLKRGLFNKKNCQI